MTKRIFNAIIAVMAIVLLSACTHNDGNIGHWFGSWKLRQITINGENDEAYQGNVFWKFQSEVVQMSQLSSYHGRTDAWGSWKEVDAEGKSFLRLDFTHSDDKTSAGTGKYAPIPATHLQSGISTLEILSISGSKLQLRYIAEDATVYTYVFSKQ